ncbi:MAG TPA: histidine triad nucleotide-binding protein [Longimicrobiales bacterium]|nr:histidine triad nucleotide-binding protein [Longimicrobiales bacterium]
MAEACLFCRIASGEQEAEVVARGDGWVAFRDINPQAPTHVLLVPRRHVESVDDLEEEDRDLVADLLVAARDVARSEGLATDGYRLVVNTGRKAGQSVSHLHLHLLGGREMAWPPG